MKDSPDNSAPVENYQKGNNNNDKNYNDKPIRWLIIEMKNDFKYLWIFGLDIKMFLFITEEFPWPGLLEFELIKQGAMNNLRDHNDLSAQTSFHNNVTVLGEHGRGWGTPL